MSSSSSCSLRRKRSLVALWREHRRRCCTFNWLADSLLMCQLCCFLMESATNPRNVRLWGGNIVCMRKSEWRGLRFCRWSYLKNLKHVVTAKWASQASEACSSSLNEVSSLGLHLSLLASRNGTFQTNFWQPSSIISDRFLRVELKQDSWFRCFGFFDCYTFNFIICFWAKVKERILKHNFVLAYLNF